MTTILPDDMYDAIYPANIPANAKYVAGYVDGAWPWLFTQPGLFPGKVKVTITVTGSRRAMVGDRETGDLSPAGLVRFVQNERALGGPAIGYCNFSSWNEVQQAFNSAGVAHPPYWIADYDGIRNLPILNGIQAVAKQYANPGPYDRSCITDTFLRILGVDMSDPLSVQFPRLGTDINGKPQVGNTSLGAVVQWFDSNMSDLLRAIQQLKGDIDPQLAQIISSVLGIIPNQPLTDAQVTALANQLIAVLPEADAKAIGQKLVA